MRYLRTNEIVEPRTRQQGEQLNAMLEAEVIPKMAIVRDTTGGQRPDIRSFTRALRVRMDKARLSAGRIGCNRVTLNQLASIHTVPYRDMKYVVRDLNADARVDGLIVMSPTEGDYEDVIAELSEGKDVEGINAKWGKTPCTPEAVQEGLDHYGLWTPGLTYTLVGRGRTVGSHLIGMLQGMHGDNYDRRVHVVSRRNEGELPDAMAVSDVAIVAAGVRHQITPDLVPSYMQAVVGVCIEDIHPDVYNLPGDLLVTPVHMDPAHMGIGADTSSIAVQRTFDAAMQRMPS